jgi:hypothetical protein
MAELVYRCFERLMLEVNALPVLREVKDDIIGQLEFLRTQSLADTDRRKPTGDLREVWKNVDRQMDQHGLYDRFKPSKKLWDTIGMFVEVGQFKPLPMKREAAVQAPSKLKSMNVTNLLKAMNDECSGIPFVKERMPLKLALDFLEEESEKPKFMRNQAEIRITWKRIHPELKKRKILNEFEEQPMKSKLLEFLKG